MTPEQAQRLKNIGEITDGIRHLVTDKPYMFDYSVVDRQFLYDLLQSIIVERDEARREARDWRHKSFGDPTSIRIVQELIRENPLPWEKDAT